jgi:xanthine dehydrogenase YagT iron-sulfur-binding subunit
MDDRAPHPPNASTWPMSRRTLFQTSAALMAYRTAPQAHAQQGPDTTSRRVDDFPPQRMPIELKINGSVRRLEVDTRTTLVDALRENLGMTGSKKGCDHGQCGACTVLVEGRRINACLTLAVMHDGQQVTTIEGLASGERLHPVQQAFLQHDGFQCGYCTPGQICSTIGMLAEAERGMPSHATRDLGAAVSLNDDEIRERMSGNLCRCSAYPNIVAAIKEVVGGRS